MDKSDLEMEEVTEQLQAPKNLSLDSQNNTSDGQHQFKDQELPQLAIGKGTNPAEVGAQEKIDGLSDLKNEGDDVKNAKSEEEGPNNVKPEETKEAADANVVKFDEPESKAEDQIYAKIGSETQCIAMAEDQTNTKIGSETQCIAKGEDQSNTNIGSETQCKDASDSKEETLVENIDQGGYSGDKAGEDQNSKENGQVNNTKEKGPVSIESTDEARHNLSGIIDEVTQENAEQMNDNGCRTGSEVVANKPNHSKTVATTAAVTDGDTEMTEISGTKMEGSDGSDTDQNSTEAEVDPAKDPVNINVPATVANDDANAKLVTTTVTKSEVAFALVANDHDPATPHVLVKCQSTKPGIQSVESYRNVFNEVRMPGDEDGTLEEQAAFMRELESFYKERATEFKAPRFYGQQLNCLKLWRSVIRLGGYDRVTGSKLWRHVGESFHPPKTCTTVSWTFRIFYEKALLQYERYKKESGELQLPLLALDPSSVDNEGSSYHASGSGRARRDSAARAMQGWHTRLFGDGEGGEQTMKDKNGNNLAKREKNLKSIGSIKQKRPNEVGQPVKAARIESSRQLVTSVVDVGPPADWVKINVRETKDSFEVYALVPGLLREEVRVQSDPAGRLVITGQPDQPDNPWGITAFKKVVSLPARIDPLQTSAIVSLHGRLFVRVPFEQSNI